MAGTTTIVQDAMEFDDLELEDLIFDNPDEVTPSEEKESEESSETPVKVAKEEDVKKTKASKKESEDKDSEEAESEESEVEVTKEDDETDDSESKESSDDDLSVIDELKQLTGLEDVEQVFENDINGVAEFVKYVKDEVSTQIAQSIVEEYFESQPELARFAMFLNNGGDPKTYVAARFPEVRYADIEVKEDDVQTQELLLRDQLRAQGYEASAIRDEIEESKASGILYGRALRAQGALAKAQTAHDERVVKEQQANADKAKRDYIAYWNNVATTIESATNLKGIPIGIKEKKELLAYITPDETGQSKADRDVEKYDLETLLAFRYLQFKGFDQFQDLIKKEASTQNAKSLRDRLSRNSNDKTKSRSQSQDANPGSKNKAGLDVGVLEDLTISDLFE